VRDFRRNDGSHIARISDVIARVRRLSVSATIVAMVLVWARSPDAATIAVRHREGVLHGFLALSALDGRQLAEGDLIQTVSGDRVTSRLVFHFKDGSSSDETSVFTERERFRLVSDRLVQHGRSFPTPLDLTIDAASGGVSVVYADAHGQQHTIRKHMDLPEDLANGLVLTLLKNADPHTNAATTVSMIAAIPQPRLVHLNLTPSRSDRFSTAGTPRTARTYLVHVDLGGITGVLAGLFGKQPPDSRVWILEGEAPAFVKSEQPFYAGGPLWRIELVSPRWPVDVHGAPRR
jgi:hypothetical protein